MTFGSREGSEGFAFSHPAGGPVGPPGVNYEENHVPRRFRRNYALNNQQTGRANHVNGYGNASETNRRRDAWRMEALHDSREGTGTDLVDT